MSQVSENIFSKYHCRFRKGFNTQKCPLTMLKQWERSVNSSLLEIIFRVSQGSMLGPLLFNIFLIYLFFIIEDTDIVSYADDNSPYVSADNIDGVIKFLEEASEILFKRFNDTFAKINADKCNLLVGTNNSVKNRNF